LAASVFACAVQPARAAETVEQAIDTAGAAYRDGRVLTAEKRLSSALDGPERSPADRARLLQFLLTLCTRADDLECLVKWGPEYAQAVERSSVGGQAQHERGREAYYFIEYAGYAVATGKTFQSMVDDRRLDWGSPAHQSLYLRQKLLAAQVYVWADRPADALRQVDKALSLIASFKNPEEARLELAWGLTDIIGLLMQVGDTERAFGLYKAAAPAIVAILPPRSIDAVRFHYVEAQLMEQVGLVDQAATALDLAIAGLAGLEVSPGRHEALAADLFVFKAVFDLMRGDLGAAQEALARHPFAAIYRQAGRAAATDREISYLAARALIARASGLSDPVVITGLGGPRNATVSPEYEGYRQAGLALATSDPSARNAALVEAGVQLLKLQEQRRSSGVGAWYRPGLIDQLIATLALGAATDPALRNARTHQTAFSLTQLLSRRGATFDADAMAALSAAADEGQRASIHQMLRLRARRDRSEREAVQEVARRAIAQAPTGAAVQYDFGRRMAYREFSELLRRSSDGKAEADWTSGANLVPLTRFQAVLGPDEAALAVAPIGPSRAAYICVRRNDVTITEAPFDVAQGNLDTRLLKAALTAGHAPSDTLDAQYPVAAAMRLYDALIRPFEPCLRPGGKVLWLPNLSTTPVPLAALLPAAPPRLADGKGYDLAAADWFVKRQVVAYAGSAAVVVAARGPGARSGGDLDFLGVGDPVMRGATAGLQALPETAEELRRSAAGFGSVQILTGQAATEANLRQQLVGSYSYISLATHGLLRQDLQGLSDPALALTPVSATQAQNDGLLTASEIADLTLRARFIALSACNTANYDLTQASAELPALASAFAVAGTPATLATLWPVDSTTSAAVAVQTFANLKGGQGPAGALAESQRAFLEAPPSRAYLHPRFWAPFVLLGDGAAPKGMDHGPVLTRVQTVDGGDGEVIALTRTGKATAAQFTSAKDASGRHGAGLLAGDREPWRVDRRELGATRVLMRLGDVLVAGRYDTTGGAGRAVLDAYDAVSGRPLGTWTDPDAGDLNGFVLAGVALEGDRAAVAVSGLSFDPKVDKPPRLRVLEVDAGLSPRLLFEVEVPKGIQPEKVTLTRIGDRLLLTYGEIYPAGAMDSPTQEDDFDYRACGPGPAAYAELRDLKGGRLVAATRWDAAVLDAAASGRAVVLAGQVRGGCGEERRAAVWRVADDLQLKPLWKDASPGESQATTVGVAAGGALAVGALKRSVVDRRADSVASGWRHTAMLVLLDRNGRASSPKLLDAGADVLVSAIEASDPNDIQLGGALGDNAVIFHLRNARR
jgi:CHAT domain-containing protein